MPAVEDRWELLREGEVLGDVLFSELATRPTPPDGGFFGPVVDMVAVRSLCLRVLSLSDGKTWCRMLGRCVRFVAIKRKATGSECDDSMPLSMLLEDCVEGEVESVATAIARILLNPGSE